MFVENEYRNEKFRGMNPDFVRRVVAKRKREEAERRHAEAEENARLLMARREAIRACKTPTEIDIAAREQAAAIVARYRDDQLREVPLTGARRTVREIIAEVALQHGVAVSDILGVSRERRICDARQEAMWRAKTERPDMGLPTLGKIFRKDHTTVLHAFQKIEAQRAKEAA